VAASNEKNIWKSFRNNKELLAKHGVTDEELDFLEKVEMFGSLKSVSDVLFILRNIRTSTDSKGGSSPR
jgi:hypothetical protein